MTYLLPGGRGSDALSGPVSGEHADARAAWIAAVKRKGATVTRMPSGAHRGKLAARYGTKKPYRYVLASPGALAVDVRENAQLARDRARGATNGAAVRAVVSDAAHAPVIAATRAAAAAGQAARVAVDVGIDAAKLAAQLPRKTAAAVLGVPEWAVPVLLIGGAAFVFMELNKGGTFGGRGYR